MENLETKLLEYLNSSEKALVDIAPKAYETTVGLVYLSAWITLITGAVFAVATIIWFVAVKKIAKRLHDDCEETAPLWICGGAVGFFLGVVPAVVHLFSKSAWIGVINPELGLIWEIYQKFLG